MTATRHDYVVPDDLAGERVDFVVAKLADVSRTVARRAIDAEEVKRNGNLPKPSDRVEAGDAIIVALSRQAERIVPDASVPFEVLYEDAALVVVDKPAGVVVHAGAGTTKPTLVHGLIARYPEIEGVGQEGRWGIVHRLDRDTSGLLVVARTNDAYLALVDMIRKRQVTRRYLSVVTGEFANTTGTIDAPITRDPRNRTRMIVQQEGRPSVTHYRRLATWGTTGRTLLSVTLETGRTHQIRVHMRAIDHPIVGDQAYGRSGGAGDPGRPWLHARQLAFNHPLDSGHIEVLAPLPSDLSDSLESLGDPDDGETIDVNGDAL